MKRMGMVIGLALVFLTGSVFNVGASETSIKVTPKAYTIDNLDFLYEDIEIAPRYEYMDIAVEGEGYWWVHPSLTMKSVLYEIDSIPLGFSVKYNKAIYVKAIYVIEVLLGRGVSDEKIVDGKKIIFSGNVTYQRIFHGEEKEQAFNFLREVVRKIENGEKISVAADCILTPYNYITRKDLKSRYKDYNMTFWKMGK